MSASIHEAMLIVGHPGHELYLHGWMEAATPTVFVLTDGSGHCNPPRIAYSRDCIERTGARVGAVFGQRSDREWYDDLMAGDPRRFVTAAETMLDAARELDVRLIVSDARDGYNPLHDAAFDLAAIVVAGLRAEGRTVRHLVSPAVGVSPHPAALVHELDAAAVERKAQAFSRYSPLEGEIAHVQANGGLDMTHEAMFPVYDGVEPGDRPDYERYGAERVAAGIYARSLQHGRDYLAVMDEMRRAILRA